MGVRLEWRELNIAQLYSIGIYAIGNDIGNERDYR